MTNGFLQMDRGGQIVSGFCFSPIPHWDNPRFTLEANPETMLFTR
jgi:hypothetical protein